MSSLRLTESAIGGMDFTAYLVATLERGRFLQITDCDREVIATQDADEIERRLRGIINMWSAECLSGVPNGEFPFDPARWVPAIEALSRELVALRMREVALATPA